jgi:hypothetical protein
LRDGILLDLSDPHPGLDHTGEEDGGADVCAGELVLYPLSAIKSSEGRRRGNLHY